MQFTNYQIYDYAQALLPLLNDETIYIPAKANFYIQKNLHLLIEASQDIEKARLKIAQHYGILNKEKNQYVIPEDKVKEANNEINDLFSIEQNLDIKPIQIKDLGDIQLTPKQMQALMFMIEE